MEKKAIVLLAEGFEEVEAVTPIDYLRRAGIAVTIAAVGGSAADGSLSVKGARGITLNADTFLCDIIQKGETAAFDAVIIPGGMPGAANITASRESCSLITEMAAAGKLVCAICASPAVVLAPLGLLSGKKFTCYPGMEEKVQNGKWTDERVAIDGVIVTSRSAGTAGEFAVSIIGQLLGAAEGDKIAQMILLK
ncbi:MAG: DJ-1/PfpI family protein [Treponema sp.]|jgi:4-methyl-5(b-hydroxyethyl)-thiazole monophosphate biosynthesis|nr:DJ-1/PfpI family protein [Treponema sp.]